MKLRRSIVAALIVLVAFSQPGIAFAEAADIQHLTAAEVVSLGTTHERARDWQKAIELYEAAAKRWPADEDISYGLRRARTHFSIDRRYADRSFERALKGSRTDALSLLDEVLNKVQDNYVDRISTTSFVAHGTESLYMALANDDFLEQNIPNASTQAVRRMRRVLLDGYWNKKIRFPLNARDVVLEVCEAARREVGLRSTAVIMEYIYGGCNALDNYSSVLTVDRLSDLYGNIRGDFVGLGIEMKAERGNGMFLVNVLTDSPAELGGLRPGEFIVAIDGNDCRNMSTDEAARLLRGPSGSHVDLEIENRVAVTDGSGGDSTRRRNRTFVRRAVKVKSIPIAEIIDASRGIGYIKMSGFQQTTTDELDDALYQLEGQGMRALIWDLRDNPGGLLDTAAEVLDRFIPGGVLVSTRGRITDQNQTFSARPYSTRQYPLVLLVDGQSASASEIVAGAIKDHNRGMIVGEQTYGKWSVQSIFQLQGQVGLRLTTAKFYSPHNRNLSEVGVAPDVIVGEDEDPTTIYDNAIDHTAHRPLSDGPRTAADRRREVLQSPAVLKGLEILQQRISQR